MGRFSDILKRMNPINGFIINSKGEAVNRADLMQRQDSALTVFNQMQTAEYTPLVERKPLPTISKLRDKVEGAGTVGVVSGEIQIDASAGLTAVYTRDYGRYLPGLISLAGISVRIPDVSTGHYEYGYGNGDGNRMGLEWDNGEPYTFIESAGQRWYRRPRSEWFDPLDGTGPSGFTLGSGGQVLRIPFGWYGYLSITWVVAFPSRDGDQLVTIDRSDQRPDAVTIEQPDLPIFAEADGGVIYIGGRHFGVYGRYRPQFRITSSPNVQKTVDGTDFTPIMTYRTKADSIYRGVPVQLSGVGMLSADTIEWALFVDTTLTGATFSDSPIASDGETALEMDLDATAMTGGVKIFSDNLEGGRGGTVGADNVDQIDVNIPRELPVTLAARAVNVASTTVDAVFRAREEW